MTRHIVVPTRASGALTGPLVSVAPVAFPSEGRPAELQVRVTAPVTEHALPVVVLSHGHGPSQYASSLYGYASLANYLAASGFAVLQPTHLDSMTLGLRDAPATEAPLYWRSRARDVSLVLDHLDVLTDVLPAVAGRLDVANVAVVGHSMGGHTAGMVLGSRPRDPATGQRVDARDARVRAGVMMAAPGRGGDALSPGAANHYPVLSDTDFSTMLSPTLVIAGDQDHARHLNVVGAEWQTDAYRLAPGPKFLLAVHGGEHSLGGIAGYDVAETTDEDLPRAAMVMRMTAAFLRTQLGVDSGAWAREVDWLRSEPAHTATVSEKC
ncbi:alpha/beta hydrolase family protein [Nocardioides sp. Soil805]|uniref:alpha/beta hydrolase family protein n=1 Tax=Nocardioides sp. Soil805 TaxID=1736416 RepID=UPI00070248B7|nr:chlorophyllase [Nocardioides sp. Soil805]KRF32302.1 chlorophyllase [Nocardioides sp. Soil805]